VISIAKSITIGNGEKELCQVFNELAKYGRSNFNLPNRSEHTGLARKIGIKCKSLVDEDLILPPLSSTNRHRVTGVQLPIDVKIKKEKAFNGWKYIFQRE